ncbi:retrovirus-related pol polyprotein from transposon TNT 1-94 [Tanacetum coccineum]
MSILTSIQPDWQSNTRMNKLNEIRDERLARTANPLALLYYDPKPAMVTEDKEMSKEKEIDKLMALISLSGTGYDNQRTVNVAGAWENVGTPVVQKSGIQCYNCKEYGHVSKESDWKDDSDDEYEDQELEAHYMYMAQIQEVTPDPVDNSGPIFDDEPMHKEMVADLRYFNSLEHEVDTLKSQLETQKTQFLNEIDRLSREYYYADHMNAILGVYTDLDEVTNLQCDYLETLEKCEHLEKELSKSRTMSKSFEALQKHAINLELDLQQCKEKIKNDKSFKEN